MTRRAQFFVLPSQHVSHRQQRNGVKKAATLWLAALSLMAVLVLGLAPASASISIIEFEGATISPSAFLGPFTENGFIYSQFSGSIQGNTADNPGTEIRGASPFPASNGGVLKVVSATPGAQFSFVRLDIAEVFLLFGSNGDISITVEGFLNSVSVGSEIYAPLSTQVYSTANAAGPLLGTSIDELRVTIPVLKTSSFFPRITAGRIDNLVLETAAVPEPASLIVWSLLGLTFTGLRQRRRRRA